MIHRFLIWRNERRRARNEAFAREVRAAFAAAGGRAAQRKAREPFRAKAKQIRDELGLGDDARLA